MQAAHGSDATEHSTVSGAVSDAVTNGIAAGAALVSTGLHAVAEIAKAGVRGKEESGNASDGEEKNQEEKGQEQEQGKPEEPRLQFGTFDESLAGNILGEAPTGRSPSLLLCHAANHHVALTCPTVKMMCPAMGSLPVGQW